MDWKRVVHFIILNALVGLLGMGWITLFAGFRWLDSVAGMSDRGKLISVFIGALCVGDCIGFGIHRDGVKYLLGILLMTALYFSGVFYYLYDTALFTEHWPYILLAVVASTAVAWVLRDTYCSGRRR